jgi:hypothetical protein
VIPKNSEHSPANCRRIPGTQFDERSLVPGSSGYEEMVIGRMSIVEDESADREAVNRLLRAGCRGGKIGDSGVRQNFSTTFNRTLLEG